MATDWVETCTGVRERMLDTGFSHMRIHYSADPEKDDVWMRQLSAKYGGVDSPKWRREFEIDYTAVQGQRVYPMFCNIHCEHKTLGRSWAIYRVLDHGIRHPTVCLWVAVNYRGDRHVYREYYMTNRTIAHNCQEILRRTPDDEVVIRDIIDPATRQRIPLSIKDKSPVSVISLYNSNGLNCMPADNSRVGYDKVRDGLLSALARKAVREGMVDEDSRFAKDYFRDAELSAGELAAMANKPALTFEPEVRRCFIEMRNMRFKDLTGDVTQKAAPEEMMDKDDDGPDCVRYAMQSKLPYRYVAKQPQRGSALWDIQQKRLNGANPRYVKR